MSFQGVIAIKLSITGLGLVQMDNFYLCFKTEISMNMIMNI